jgi:hypothetical protein
MPKVSSDPQEGQKDGKAPPPLPLFNAYFGCFFFPVSNFNQSGHGEKMKMLVSYIIQSNDQLIMYQVAISNRGIIIRSILPISQGISPIYGGKNV